MWFAVSSDPTTTTTKSYETANNAHFVRPHGHARGFPRRFVVLLGPSHHVFLRRCALSKCATYATPLGNLAVDTGIYDELRATGHFVDMDVDVDEAEHSHAN